MYNMNMHEDLIIALRGHGLKDHKIMGFFNDQILAMIGGEPTYKKGSDCKWQGRKYIGPDKFEYPKMDNDIWITRGYYPNTGIFYKITVADVSQNWKYKRDESEKKEYFAKVQMLVRPVKSGIRQRPAVLFIDNKYISEMITQQIEHEIFGNDTENKIVVSPQRSLAVKGCKPNSLKRRIKHVKTKQSDSSNDYVGSGISRPTSHTRRRLYRKQPKRVQPVSKSRSSSDGNNSTI